MQITSRKNSKEIECKTDKKNAIGSVQKKKMDEKNKYVCPCLLHERYSTSYSWEGILKVGTVYLENIIYVKHQSSGINTEHFTQDNLNCQLKFTSEQRVHYRLSVSKSLTLSNCPILSQSQSTYSIFEAIHERAQIKGVEGQGQVKMKKEKQMKNKHCYWKTGCFKSQGQGLPFRLAFK